MITMDAAVSNRTAEIGTLRALGLRRAAILAAFLFCVVMGLAGGFLPSVRAARLEIVDALRAA